MYAFNKFLILIFIIILNLDHSMYRNINSEDSIDIKMKNTYHNKHRQYRPHISENSTFQSQGIISSKQHFHISNALHLL